jgi:hypothetical protein
MPLRYKKDENGNQDTENVLDSRTKQQYTAGKLL